MNNIQDKIFKKLEFWIPRLTGLWQENLKFKQYSKTYLNEKEIRDIAIAVKELSEGLKGERNFIGKKYLGDINYLGAYLLYFWPVSYAQTSIILNNHNIKCENVLDLGCGPGPNTMAIMDHGAKRILSCDRVRSATVMLKKLSFNTKYLINLKEWDILKNQKIPDGKFDLIFMGHFLNELWKDHKDKINLRKEFIIKLKDSLKPGAKICILEPALTKTSRDLIELRNILIKNNLFIYGPCLINDECKIFDNKDNTTCHSEYSWKIPRLVKKISNFAGIKKDLLKFNYLIIQKEKNLNNHDNYLVVSDPLLSKNGRLRYFICGKKGRVGVSVEEKLKPIFKDSFLKLKRGNIIKIKNCDIVENSFILNQNSIIELIKK